MKLIRILGFILGAWIFSTILLHLGYIPEKLLQTILNLNNDSYQFFTLKSSSELAEFYPRYFKPIFYSFKIVSLHHTFSFLILSGFTFLFYSFYKPQKQKIFSVFLICSILMVLNFFLIQFRVYERLGLLDINESNFTLMQFNLVDETGINIFDKTVEIREHSDYGINEQGFRCKFNFEESIATQIRDTSSLIMFVGDSHTEGCCAKPITNSFVDLIDIKPEITVANFGVGGMDLLQYRLILEKYLKVLNPDLVVIPVCMSNDFVKTSRSPNKTNPLYYQTTIGYFSATYPTIHKDYEFDKYFENWEETKRYYLENLSLNIRSESLVSKLIYSHSYLNRVFLNYSKIVTNNSNLKVNGALNFSIDQKDYDFQLHKIDSICASMEVPLVIVGVPSINPIKYINVDDVVEEYGIYYSNHYESSDFTNPINDHFNNTGHAKFANYLWPIIDSTLTYQTLPNNSLPN